MTTQPHEKLPVSSLRKITHRELALADPLYLMGHYMEQTILPHRERILDFIMQPSTHKILLAPREHWKTTTHIGYMVWRILRDPNIRILVIAHNMDFARDIVVAIRDNLVTPDIRRDFGDLHSSRWGKEAFTVKRAKIRKEPTCMAAGQGTGVLGRHFDIIWCDDIIKVETQWTEDQRDKIFDWYRGTLLRCCDREMLITGTRKHIKDLYFELMEEGSYDVQVFKAIDDDTGALFAPGLKECQEPPQDTRSWLDNERYRMGDLWFAQEMQNEPVAMKGLDLKREWLRYYDPAHPPAFNWLYMGVDPAVGKSDVASYTAVVLLGVTPDLRFYVLDMQRHRWHVEWEDRIIELWERYCHEGRRPLTVAVEAVMTFQYVTLPLVEKSTMPVRFVNYRQAGDTQVKDKIARIHALGTHFQHGRVYLPDNDQDPMTGVFEREEYLIFPEKEGHTDLLDALNLAINEAPRSIDEESFWGC